MEKTRELVWSRSVGSADGTFLLFLYREYFSAVFPHMIRYTLLLQDKNEIIAVFRTNNYEYSPTVPLDAESSAHRVAEEWAEALQKDPISFLSSRKVHMSPAYTNTVPGSLKILIDRCQAYQAAIVLVGRLKGPRGLILGVCGRKGQDNFRCLVPVLEAFMENVGIKVASRVLVDDVDESRDIASIQGLREEVQGQVFDLLEKR